MSDDDKISVASKDVGEYQAAAKGQEESSKAMECYSLILGEYRVELTNSHKLLVKLRQQTCTCRVWQTRGIPCCHALAMIAKANLWVYDYVHPIYKTATQQIIYNQLVHPMETHDMGTVDAKTGRVVEPHQVAIHRCPQFIDSFALCSYWEHTPAPVCVLMIKYNFACSLLSGNLKCLPGRRQMFIAVNHGLQPVNPWVTVTLQSWHFDILIILDSELSPHPHACLDFNVQVTCHVDPTTGRC
ncbi:hypothetical protein Cgig2_020714 [Carnegiea gigantea]|uniref:SWIM-type domain-containing protein n=1 Tax=Carnegiea gigantea TaxID=171969 RepID=A0A9Q1JMK1_9CARY|nr:hypothetical protein Cgig2_020714 [Carnegiea gigantea]